jgi:dienelactone hydrolase
VLRTTYRCGVVALALAVLTGCGGGSGKKEPSLAAPFAYDDSQPLNVQSQTAAIGVRGLRVRDIAFDGPDGVQVIGYLISPPDSDRHPAVVFAHGGGGSRVELFQQAAALAQDGAVALTLEMPYSPRRAQQLPPGIEGLRAQVDQDVQSVQEVRRAVDVLRSLPSVDGDRIGYVGWSAGARTGAIVAGLEHRIKAFDLLAGGAAPVGESVRAAPPELRSEVSELVRKTSPLRYVGHAAPSALLFQDGRTDELVPHDALVALAKAGSEPKDVRWYDSGHTPTERAWVDSRRWLDERLDIK